MQIHSVLDTTDVNGPGTRSTFWFQGCSIACGGCSNPGTWDPKAGTKMSVLEVVRRIEDNIKKFNIDGVTFSGGEPLEQYEDLFKVLSWLKFERFGIDIMLYSGKPKSEINEQIFNYIDILVDGPYVEKLKSLDLRWRGSSNQNVHFLNDNIRERMKDHYGLLDSTGQLIDKETGTEFIVDREGSIELTGFSNLNETKLKRLVK